jgi:hypothetical protein
MTPTFHDKLEALAASSTIEEYMECYRDFVNSFGHGCVTTIHLAAGSAFRLTLKRTDDASASLQKYSGSASLSGHYGGVSGSASVATSWAKEQQRTDSKATLEVTMSTVPQNAPTMDWVNSMLSNFNGQAISELANKPNPISQSLHLRIATQ